jgi:hypothetical protein
MRLHGSDEWPSGELIERSAAPERRAKRRPKSQSRVYYLKRIVGVFVFPAILMVGIASIAPNPDGALVLAVACMFAAASYLKS